MCSLLLYSSSTIIQELSTSFTVGVCEKASHNIYSSNEVQNFYLNRETEKGELRLRRWNDDF